MREGGASFRFALRQAKADRNGVVDLIHHGRIEPAHVLAQAALVKRADLLGQDDAVLCQTAAVGPHIDVGGQAVFVLTACDGGCNDGGAVPVADLILYDKYR